MRETSRCCIVEARVRRFRVLSWIVCQGFDLFRTKFRKNVLYSRRIMVNELLVYTNSGRKLAGSQRGLHEDQKELYSTYRWSEDSALRKLGFLLIHSMPSTIMFAICYPGGSKEAQALNHG